MYYIILCVCILFRIITYGRLRFPMSLPQGLLYRPHLRDLVLDDDDGNFIATAVTATSWAKMLSVVGAKRHEYSH